MIVMTEPQVWAAIGVLAAALVGMITVTTQLMMRGITAQFAGLRNELKSDLSGLRTEVKGEIAGVRTELKSDIAGLRSEMELRFGHLQAQIDGLDRDVQAISRRVFPE